LVTLQNVSFFYPHTGSAATPVLRGVNLTIEAGEFVAVAGHNGSGKSTLAKLLNAILQPASGRVLIDGMDTADPALTMKIRQSVGMVFQNPDNQMVATVVEEDVAFALENLGVEPNEIRRRVDQALATVGMSDYAEHAPHMLSGGQKQRVAIAGVIAMRPKVLVLDEPTAMLDPAGRREVLHTIRDLCKNDGITVILITHHMDEAAGADRVLVMRDGRVDASGPPSMVFSQEELLRNAGLSAPQTAVLAWRLMARGIPLQYVPLTAESCADALYGVWKS